MQTPPGEEPTVPAGERQGEAPPPAHSYPPQQPVPPQAYPGMYGQPPYPPSASYPGHAPSASYPGYPPSASYPGYAPYGPPYAPPPPQPRSSNKGLWIGLSILGVVILLSCVGCAAGLGLLISNSTRTLTSSLGPELVASEMCSDEQISDYIAVYDLFSSNLQGQTTQDQFVAASQAREQSNGVVRDCVAQPGAQPQNGRARVQITLTLNDGQHSGYITLVQRGGLWQIDSYDDSLGLT